MKTQNNSFALKLLSQPRRNSASVLSIAIIAALSFSAPEALAQEAGRLPDGRAFRTDSQGMRLVDHIAELEVSVRELTLQVEKLEYELADKDRKLAGKSGTPAAAPISAPTAACDVAPYQTKIAELERNLTEVSSRPVAPTGLPLQRGQELEAQVAKLQQSLNEQQREAMTLRNQLQSANLAASSQVGGAKEETKQYQKALAERDSEVETLSVKATNLEKQLSKNSESEAKLNERIQKADAEIARLTDELDRRRERESELLAKGEQVQRQQQPQSTQRRETSTSSAARVQTASVGAPLPANVQKELSKELNDVQALITKRKDLFDSLRAKKRGVTIGLQPLNTRRGVTLDSLRGQMKDLDSSNASGMRQSLAEIRAILLDDIRTIQRLLS